MKWFSLSNYIGILLKCRTWHKNKNNFSRSLHLIYFCLSVERKWWIATAIHHFLWMQITVRRHRNHRFIWHSIRVVIKWRHQFKVCSVDTLPLTGVFHQSPLCKSSRRIRIKGTAADTQDGPWGHKKCLGWVLRARKESSGISYRVSLSFHKVSATSDQVTRSFWPLQIRGNWTLLILTIRISVDPEVDPELS